MSPRPPATGKWRKESMTHTVEFFHSRIRALAAGALATPGATWEQMVADPPLARTDLETLDAELVGTGYRYEMSAQISLREAPEKYQLPERIKDSGAGERDEHGRTVAGTGANVFQASEDLAGTARMISTTDTVMDMLVNGVPEGTIAVIDDSGGTLTAPILENFAGVVCMGGTVRSHLGILTREYGVPCLMDVQLDGLHDGDRVQVEYSKPPADAYAEADPAARAHIWKLG
jgi:phosphohistidine swiveling domain-containing protein